MVALEVLMLETTRLEMVMEPVDVGGVGVVFDEVFTEEDADCAELFPAASYAKTVTEYVVPAVRPVIEYDVPAEVPTVRLGRTGAAQGLEVILLGRRQVLPVLLDGTHR